ncbi:hypothetical protein RJ641_013000, partial [Dillenia turbinata]
MSSMEVMRAKSKQALLLWFEGFREACCLHRVIIYCFRSRMLLIRTGQCFLLNGFIFLGSIFILKSVVMPILQWILPDQCLNLCSQELCSLGGILKFYSFLRVGLIQLFYVLWFYPLYLDIAKHGYIAMGSEKHADATSKEKALLTSKSMTQKDKMDGLGGVMIGVGEQTYSVLLLTFFFLEVYATGVIPFLGKGLNFLLLSWIYKWNLSGVSLDKRLDFFESNWAFFAGFGNPCVLASFFFSPLVGYGVMAILFPLFVLTATGSDADLIIGSLRSKWKGAGLGRLPIFYAADTLSYALFITSP